ncbi:sulfatase-like hydrolase/transferase [bacterium]|nr:sulfatase-like hydrolase/transferase [bacterium]
MLSTFFSLVATGAYVGYAERRRRRDYALTTLFFAAALMAKPMVVTLPFVFLILDYWPLRRVFLRRQTERGDEAAEPPARLVAEKIPLFALSLASSAIAFAAQRRGGSVARMDVLPFWRRLDNAVVSYVDYLWKTLVPKDLAAFYPFPDAPHPVWQFAAALSLLIGISALVVWTLREHRYPAVGWLWFLGTLVPTIGLVQVGDQALADRYTYVPLIGLFIAVSWGIHDVLARSKLGERAFTAFALLLVGGLAVPAARQVGTWRDDEALFRHAIAVTEGNFTAHNNLGNVLYEAGRRDEAVRQFEAALRIRPDYPKAHNNLANVYADLGRVERAHEHYSRALALAPDSFHVHYNLARVLVRLGRLEEAVEHYGRAVELNPDLIPGYNRLGALLVKLGRLEAAERHYREAMRRKPDDASARRALQYLRKAGEKRARSARPNVVLVTLDTTRADRLGCYGYARPTSPHIDRLAAESTVYTRAFATSSWTLPSHASLFTGRLPTSHGARQDPEGPLRLTSAIEGPESWDSYRVRGLAAGEPTLARLLAGAGYDTGAVVGGPWMKRVFGLSQGFQWYDDGEISDPRGRLARQVTDSALRFVEEAREPFFLFLNYFDPHFPYSPPQEFGRIFLRELEERGATADAGATARALYDGEIRYMDHHIGRLLADLRRRGLYDASLVVVTSDHGDLQGEHGKTGHGFHLYQEEIHIPLIVKYPAGESPAGRRHEVVQLTDVLPLILERLAIPPPPHIQGGSPPDVGHPIVAEVYPRPSSDRFEGDWRALIDGRLKLLWNSQGQHELFDLETDPGESANLLESEPTRASAMKEKLLGYLARLPEPRAESAEGEIDLETREALRGLGYLD